MKLMLAPDDLKPICPFIQAMATGNIGDSVTAKTADPAQTTNGCEVPAIARATEEPRFTTQHTKMIGKGWSQ